MPDQKYFPWESFQVWLHEAIVAAMILNRIIIESYPEPQEKMRSYRATIETEQREFLSAVKSWAEQTQKAEFRDAVNRVLQSKNGYPKLNEEEAESLFEAVSEYGTASRRLLDDVLPALRDYFATFPNPDAALKEGLNAIWRSIGPSLSADRAGLGQA